MTKWRIQRTTLLAPAQLMINQSHWNHDYPHPKASQSGGVTTAAQITAP
jgi:hypothetical protein